MKITYVAHSLLSRGGDKMILSHAGWLAETGHQVEFCCNVVDTVLDIPEGVLFSKPIFPGTIGTIISALLQRRDADIVLASIVPMACFLFPCSRRKVVYFAQDYDESYYTSPLLKWLIRFFYFVGLKFCHIPTIAVSSPLADLIQKRFNAHVFVAENGVDLKVFFPAPDQELVSTKGNRKAIFLLSRNDRRKGFDIAKDVVRSLSEKSSFSFEVWTVGEKCLGVFGPIVHRDFGYVGENRLRQIMSSADVFLYPTRHEGFGLMPLEAFACRCPVITTNAVAFASHLENALVSPVEDTERMTELTFQLLSGAMDIEPMVNCGVQTAEKMALHKSLTHFTAILEQILCGEQH